MPSSETFSYIYSVSSGTIGGTIGIGGRFTTGDSGYTGPHTLEDLRDGLNDGTTTLGGAVRLTDSVTGYDITVIALTDDGDPVIQFGGGSTWILSNDPDLPAPGSIGTTTSGSYAYCFLAGTEITTPNGVQRVEDMSIGDGVVTVDGCTIPVRWIGRQTVSARFSPAERLMPVRVRAGALGDDLPVRDLTLTADHALLIDGLLINAGALVNGTTIDYVPLSELGDSYTVYHIETENHDVILAEGAPAETYIDYVARRAFDNYAEYVALYGGDRCIDEMPYPRVSSARQVPQALRDRLRASSQRTDASKGQAA